MSHNISAKRSAALFDNVARRIGKDLQEAAILGKFSFDEKAGSVRSCMKCAASNACADWLNCETTTVPVLPKLCHNHHLLNYLKTDVS
ncbi:DUF6455 family protein [Pseudopelagicola sp. nBUS_19]|uniref:DUF6455 family protein n=1 Tax=unclassified Pseudopelagicola TaxID=2649563 RepID=UPI003EB8430A